MSQPPYKYQEWPRAYYCPETGASKVCKSIDDVPEGYVKDAYAYLRTQEEKAAEEAAGDLHNGFSKEELERIVRKGGGRVKANDTAFRLYARAEEKGLIANGQIVESESEDPDEYGDPA